MSTFCPNDVKEKTVFTYLLCRHHGLSLSQVNRNAIYSNLVVDLSSFPVTHKVGTIAMLVFLYCLNMKISYIQLLVK